MPPEANRRNLPGTERASARNVTCCSRAIPFKRCAFTFLGREVVFSLGTLQIVRVPPEACGPLVEQHGPLVGGRGPKVLAKWHVFTVPLFCGRVNFRALATV